MTINRALSWKLIELEKFKGKWRENKKFIVKTSCFRMNRRILKSGLELKNYFNGLIEINHEKEYEYLTGNGYFKFAGNFAFFNQNNEILIKFVLTPGRKLCVQSINQMQNNQGMVEFLLNSLEFLLSERD